MRKSSSSTLKLVVLTLLMTLALLPAPAAAAEEPLMDKGSWTIVLILVATIVGFIIIWLMNRHE